MPATASSALSPAALDLLRKAEDLSLDEYELLAQEMLRKVEQRGRVELSPDERAEIRAGMAEIARGEWVDGDDLLAELEAERDVDR